MIRERLPYQPSLFFFFFLSCCYVCANKVSAQVPFDTSYTVASTYLKLLRQHPHIKPVSDKPVANVRQVADVVYRTLKETPFGKRDLHADIFIPSGEKKVFPAVIMVHGGGWRSGNKALNVAMAQHLALNGFVVVSIEYRLSLEAKYPAAVHDVKAAIRWAREHAQEYQINSNKIAVAGYSAGGHLASLVGVTNEDEKFEGEVDGRKFSSTVHAVVDLDGLLDFTNAESLAVKRTANSADVSWLGGFFEEVPERWKEASPIVWVDRDAPPFLFINSSQTRFHAGCSDMVHKLNQLRIYNEVHKLEDAPHSYWFFQPWFDPTMEHMTNFLNKVFNSTGG
jgi:acetyl esterase/lipase